MPKPKKKEKKNKYISRCISAVRHEGTGQKQAVGKCYGMWDYYKKESRIYDFETFINEGRKEKLEIDKTIKKMKREDQLKSGIKLDTKVVPNKRKQYIRKKKVNPQEED
jgi:hypothetical protein